MLLILLVMLNFCCGIELTGSERAYRDNHPDAEQHKHFPYIFHPLYSKGIGKVNTHVHRPKWTVMITKTVVIETTKHLNKQPVCVKALRGVPYCHSKLKIKATPVLQTPLKEITKVIDVLETSKGKCHISHLGRKGRHVFLPNRFLHQAESLFKEFHTVTEILRITRTEYYADNIATATLIAENCLPVNEDIPPCPVNVEDYDYPFKTGLEHISIIGKEELERRIDEDGDVTSFSDENTDFNSSLLF